jgi:outer membrane protein OmpA-like peptidoglycan-associated protein
MKLVVRVFATAILGPLLLTPALAEDTAAAPVNPTKSEAGSPTATANTTGYLAPAFALAPQAKKSSSSSSDTYPAVDLFAGFSYVRFSTNVRVTPAVKVNETFNWLGFTGAVAGNVNRWFSVVGDFGVYRINDLPPNVSGSAYTFLFGPQFSKRTEAWTAFVHTLFGAARLADISVTGTPTSAFFNRSFSQNAFATALGGGLDVNINKHLGVRILQLDYLLTKFTDNNNNRQNNIRASGGLVLHFGGNPPPPPPNHPPTVTASANPTKVFAGSGDSIVLQAQAADPDNDPMSYKWSATGGGIEGTGSEVRWNSKDVKAGTYTATVTVDDGRGGTANASTEFKVEEKPNTPPTISCAANPATVTMGQRSAITSTASDPDNDNLTYAYTTSGGRITGSGASVQFDSTGTAPGSYTVTCTANDGRGGEKSATTTVAVQAAAPPKEQVQLEQRLSLHSIYFPTAQPTVANPNGGLLASQQTTLVALAADFKKYLTYKPEAHLILQGHADPRGGADYNKLLSDRRVARTKAFLVQQGVSEGAIETQGLGVEQPMSADQVKQAVDQEQEITAAQKAQLKRNAPVLALAQNRRVDVTLSTTGQTSVRQFPFNASDALNLINPKGTGGGAAKKPAPAPKAGTPKAGTPKGGAAPKKAPPKK